MTYAIGTTDNPSGVLVSIDQSTGQVMIMPQPGFTGTAHLLAGVRSTPSPDVEANYNIQAFTVTVSPPPALGTVNNQVTTVDTPDTFTLTSTDTAGAGVVYNVVDPVTLTTPTDVDVTIDPTTGQATLTPLAGFTGTINLLAEVRSKTSPDDPTNYSTQAFTLTVNPPPTLGSVSNLTTVVGAPVHFTLTSTDPAGAGVFYTVVDSSDLCQPRCAERDRQSIDRRSDALAVARLHWHVQSGSGRAGNFRSRCGSRATISRRSR